MSDHNSSAFTCSIEIHASQERVWKVLLLPNQWGQAFGEGTVVDVVWEEGASIIWRDGENNIGANGCVEIIRPQSLLQLRYYDEVSLTPDALLGNHYERFIITALGEKHSRLEIDVAQAEGVEAAFHKQLWNKALRLIKTIAENV